MEWCVPKHVPPDSKHNNFSSTKLHNSPKRAKLHTNEFGIYIYIYIYIQYNTYYMSQSVIWQEIFHKQANLGK